MFLLYYKKVFFAVNEGRLIQESGSALSSFLPLIRPNLNDPKYHLDVTDILFPMEFFECS